MDCGNVTNGWIVLCPLRMSWWILLADWLSTINPSANEAGEKAPARTAKHITVSNGVGSFHPPFP